MRMPWSSHLCCVLFLAAIGQILAATEMQDKTVSYSHDRSRLYDFSKKEFKCLWRCEVNESDLRNKVNTAFTEGNKLISLTIKFSYPKKVDEKCMSQTSNNSIGGDTKQWNYSFWQIFLIDRKLPISVNNAIRRFSSWIGAHVDVYVKVNCSLQFTAKSANRQHLSGELSSRGYLERILRSTAASLGELCNTEVEQNDQQTCIKITNGTNDRWTILIAFVVFFFHHAVRLYWPCSCLSFCCHRGHT